jgi:exosortase
MIQKTFSKQTVSDELRRVFSKENDQLVPGLVIGALCVLLVYTYGNSLLLAAGTWTSSQYSHAWVVPLFAAALLWMRRKPIGKVTHAERWYGAGLVCAALTARMVFGWLSINTADMWTFIPAVAGVFLMVGGWRTFRWSWAPIAFLFFMFPLPMQAEQRILHRLQEKATIASVYTLQTLGVSAYREGGTGNVIAIDGLATRLNVIDQCAGLRMLTIFVAMCLGIAMVISGPWWEKAIIIVSSIPIALVVNLVRIVVTGLLYVAAETSTWITRDIANWLFHDLAGWFMMPLALGLLFLELAILSRLFVEVKEDRTPQIRIGPQHRMRPVAAK